MNENMWELSAPSQPTAEIDLSHAKALQRIISELSALKHDDRRRIVETVSTFFGLHSPRFESYSEAPTPASPIVSNPPFKFSGTSTAPSPKSFMLEKSPQTDVERVACLAYYLAHYRDTTHFKTKDITALNTESAHRALSNTTYAVDNATKAGFLVPSIKGSKQLSALGEQYVEALPDREAASDVLIRLRRPRKIPRKSNSKSVK